MTDVRESRATRRAAQGGGMREDRTVLVAGYDGTPDAAAAVRWAARNMPRDGCLIVVCAHHPAVPSPVRAAGAARARAQLEALWMEEEALVEVDVQLAVVDEPPAEALMHAALRTGAETIVVGRHRGGAFRGDTVRHLLALADRPVTVVPG